jgi:hypothetical protein
VASGVLVARPLNGTALRGLHKAEFRRHSRHSGNVALVSKLDDVFLDACDEFILSLNLIIRLSGLLCFLTMQKYYTI